ncbi:MAG: hypothetical protein ACE5K8_04190 [Candidatus Zixiibacteriota bacterium]
MKTYLNIFEQAVHKHASRVGEKVAFEQARKAGLKISDDGHIVNYTGNPQVVLLRLVRFFTEDGCTASLDVCESLIDEILRKYTDRKETIAHVG